MAVDPRRRQKKLERRRAKEKAKRRERAQRKAMGIAGQLQYAARFPILHCRVAADLWEDGLGAVLLSRQLGGGTVAFVMFLVDVYCLGVKDLIMDIVAREQYEEFYERLVEKFNLVPIKPEAARKIVEGAVQYAHDLGLTPHHEYHKARSIFGDIDSSACTEQFEYGCDGKPTFIADPDDDPAKCRYVIEVLKQHCGEDGFHFVIPAQAADFTALETLDGSPALLALSDDDRLLVGLDDDDQQDLDDR